MCQKIDKVFQLAKRTFSRKPPDKDSLDKLLKNVNELTGKGTLRRYMLLNSGKKSIVFLTGKKISDCFARCSMG